MRVQRVLVRDEVGLKNEDCVVASLVTLFNEFPSNFFDVNVSGELLSKIGDKCVWKVGWSPVVDVDRISGLKNGEVRASSCGDWGSGFVDKAKPGKRESESVDEVEEIFVVFL